MCCVLQNVSCSCFDDTCVLVGNHVIPSHNEFYYVPFSTAIYIRHDEHHQVYVVSHAPVCIVVFVCASTNKDCMRDIAV